LVLGLHGDGGLDNVRQQLLFIIVALWRISLSVFVFDFWLE
jgi:hypothetical protein